MNLLNAEQKEILNYNGELTIEAISVLDTYSKTCCSKSLTAKKLKKSFQSVNKYLKQPFVRDIFKLKLLEKGVTPEAIAETIQQGLYAEHTICNKDGILGTEPDWHARHKFVQLASEIFEVLKYNTKVDVELNALTMHLNPELKDRTDDDIKKELSELGAEILHARQGT